MVNKICLPKINEIRIINIVYKNVKISIRKFQIAVLEASNRRFERVKSTDMLWSNRRFGVIKSTVMTIP
jgi:hypothetical protein